VTQAGVITTTDYLSGFQYKNNVLQFFMHAEGYVNVSKSDLKEVSAAFNYVFNYTDHLGNIRLSYSQDPSNSTLKVIEENHYYPFGLKHTGYNSDKMMLVKEASVLKIKPMPPLFKTSYNYKYNGKEYQDELGLNMYDYGARNYDAALGRWMNVDPLAELSRKWSPYSYCYDNPLIFTDPDGMYAAPPTDLFNSDGEKIGTDGVNNKQRMLVTNDDEAKKISKTKGNIDLSTVKSGEMLEDNSVLQESLNVIERTEKNGGLSEESSLVMNDNTVVIGQTGSPVDLSKDEFAGASLPNIPDGKTTADVKATIHSHVIGSKVVNGEIKSMSATEPSVGKGKDTETFAQYKTNVIVGRLGKTSADLTQQSAFNKTVSTNKPSLGISVFRGSSTTPAYSLTKSAVKKILKQ